MISRERRTHGRGIMYPGDTAQNKREPLWTSAEGATVGAATPLESSLCGYSLIGEVRGKPPANRTG